MKQGVLYFTYLCYSNGWVRGKDTELKVNKWGEGGGNITSNQSNPIETYENFCLTMLKL